MGFQARRLRCAERPLSPEQADGLGSPSDVSSGSTEPQAESLAHFDLVTRSIGACQERVGLIIAHDLLGLVVPFQIAPEAGRDACQVANIEHFHMGMHI